MRGGILQSKLENAVWESVNEFFLDTQNLKDEIARRKAESQSVAQRKTNQLQAIEAAISEIDRKMGLLLDQMLTNGFAQDILDQRKNELTTQRAQFLVEAGRIKTELKTTTITPEQEEEMLTLSETVRTGLAAATFEEKRHLLDLIRLRVDVIDQKQLRVSGLISAGAIVDISSA
jgi:chorismate mutase